MLVDGETLDVAPAADQLLEAAAGELTDEYDERRDRLEQRARAARHRIQVQRPEADARRLGHGIRRQRELANDKLGREGLRLMPTAMHPWMDPNDVKLCGRTARASSTTRSTASSRARATAGRICRACRSTCRSPATRSSRGCTRRFASCCRSCRVSPRARRSSTASATASSTTASSSIAAIARASRRSRARSCRSPWARSANTTSACSSRSTATSRRTIPKACCATNGSMLAARSRVSTAWRSRSACSTCRRRPPWTSPMRS